MKGNELRLVPAALAAWLVAAIAIVVSAPILSAGLWLAAVVVTAFALRTRKTALTLLALGITASALVATSAAVHATARAPTLLVEAAESNRAVTLELTATGRPTDGRLPGTVVAATIGGTRTEVDVPVLIFDRDARADFGGAVIGSTVRLTGTLVAAEPGDDVAFLVHARGEAEVIAGPPALLGAADGIRSGFRREAVELPDPGGGLLPGLAIGDTSAVGATLDQNMKSSSLSHLTAVSGANCAIVVALVIAIAAGLGMPRPVRVGVAAIALVGFVILVTPEPSVLRAAVMASFALVAFGLGRPARGIPVLCLAVIVLLAADPWLARSYGFALSALATAGLLVLARPIAAVLARWLPRGLALVLAVPIAAQLACQPVILMLNPALPVYGIVANLLAEPAAPLATVLGLAACLLLPVVHPLGVALTHLAWLPSAWIAAVANFFATLPGAQGVWPVGPLGVGLLIAITLIGLIAALPGAPRRVRRIAQAAMAVAVVCYLGVLAGTAVVKVATRPGDWEFALCDIGQGDATIIRSEGRIAVVDVGPKPERMTRCLDELGIGRIDLLVLTHYDLDHVGGVDAVAGRVDRAIVGLRADPGDDAIAAELERGGATVEHGVKGMAGTLGALDWQLLWPPPSGVEPGNPASVVLAVHAGSRCVAGCLSGILLGDLGEESQRRLLGSVHPGRFDVVKVSHHGSADQSAELYEALGATVGLIGVGADNDYGHPTDKLLGVLAATGTAAYRTDLDGLTLVAEGEMPGEVRVWTEK